MIPGVRIGHWTGGGTGCTVLLLPAGAVASGEVRGGAPGTREWALLDPRRTVDRVNAVVLAGRSAFGLAACDGVVQWCEERGIGWPTSFGPVPIVVGMVVYDLSSGDAAVRPGPQEGYAACVAARTGDEAVVRGRVGAAAGVTVAKWKGPEFSRSGALGAASVAQDGVTVAAMVVVNAVGDLVDGSGPRVFDPTRAQVSTGENTTIGVVMTDAGLDKVGCRLMAESALDGLARAVDPVHTAADGDAFVAVATGAVGAPLSVVRSLATWVVTRAVEDALATGS